MKSCLFMTAKLLKIQQLAFMVKTIFIAKYYIFDIYQLSGVYPNHLTRNKSPTLS